MTFAQPMRNPSHLDDLVVSNLVDALPVAPGAVEHLTDCLACRARLDDFRTVRAAAAVERLRGYEAPDCWPRIAALTVEAAGVRRAVLRSLRVPLVLWTLAAFALGAVATEAAPGGPPRGTRPGACRSHSC